MFNKGRQNVVKVLLEESLLVISPHRGCFVWLCQFRNHAFRNLCAFVQLTSFKIVQDVWNLLNESGGSERADGDYRLVKNHRGIFTGEPWLLHLLSSVSSQRQRCGPPSALRSWAREAAPRLVLETTWAPLPAALVFLIRVALMQVGAFTPQQHCCFSTREGMTTPTSSWFYCEVNIWSTVWKYLKFKSVCYVIVETSLAFAFYCIDVCVCFRVQYKEMHRVYSEDKEEGIYWHQCSDSEVALLNEGKKVSKLFL